MIEAYPLYWPEGWQRTPSHKRDRSHKFKQSFGANRDDLLAELRRLGSRNVILSTNVPLRRDGLPYADARVPNDPGVAVYFEYKKNRMCFACDKYQTVSENIRAIALTIDALRGIERWGASDMLERAFRGFLALPGPEQNWKTVLGLQGNEALTAEDIESAFREKAHLYHPDKGGSPEIFCSLVEARKQAHKEIGT